MHVRPHIYLVNYEQLVGACFRMHVTAAIKDTEDERPALRLTLEMTDVRKLLPWKSQHDIQPDVILDNFYHSATSISTRVFCPLCLHDFSPISAVITYNFRRNTDTGNVSCSHVSFPFKLPAALVLNAR